MEAISQAITAEAGRLEKRLNDNLYADEPTHQVILAAAWEVSELELLFTSGNAHHILWAAEGAQ